VSRRPFRISSLAAAGLVVLGFGVFTPVAGADPSTGSWVPPGFQATQIVSGSSLHHTFTPVGSTTTASTATETLSKPDDITQLGDELFVGFQNGVGPQGEPNLHGNTDSTIVQFSQSGHVLHQWDITGKADGVTADPALGAVVVTVNEDNISSLYVIDPDAAPASAVTHYQYNEALPHGGGTDAISVVDGKLFISASAPGTTGLPAPQATYPAVYSVTLDPADQVATVTPLFSDEDPATVANVNGGGTTTNLALTDPDSSEVVPWGSPRFGGQFLLTSQGDQQQIYVSDPGGPHQHLSVLTLSQAVDDTAWATSWWGVLYATDSTHDTVDAVTGWFGPDRILVAATPCGVNIPPSTCSATPALPANYLGSLDPWTGHVQRLDVDGQPFTPQGGLLFVPRFPSRGE
jgi:hypothetical protein